MGRSRTLILGVWASALASCGLGTDPYDAIRERAEHGDRVYGATLAELLDDPGAALVVVEGTISSVENGVGMNWTFENDLEQRHLLPFDDPDAEVVSVHGNLAVGRVHRSPSGTNVGSNVLFGLAADAPDAAGALLDLDGDEVVAVLQRSPVFDDEDDLYGVLIDGGLLCHRSGDGLAGPGPPDGADEALDVDGAAADLMG